MRFLPYEDRFQDSFVQLLKWAFGMSSSTPDAHIRWKFFNHPHADRNRIWCAVDETTVAGQYANVGRSFSYRGEEYPGYLCQDMCVHPDYRGQGLVLGMSKPVYEDIPSGTFTIGFSNEQGVKVDRNSKEYGYQVVRELVTSYFPLMPLLGSLPHNWTFQEVSDAEFRSAPFDRFGLFPNHIRMEHDTAYVTWRYADRPEADYRRFLLRKADGTPAGYAVFRPSRGGLSLIDFDAEGISPGQAFRSCLAIARSTGAWLMGFRHLPNAFWAGVFSCMPRVSRSAKLYLTAKVHGTGDIPVLDPERWVLMAGDVL